MARYLLSVYQPDGEPPEAAVLDQIRSDLDILNDEMRRAGAWIFSDGLFPPSTATVVTLKGSEMITTDGPYVESKEHLGGISLIEAEDLDAALMWARKLARATTLPIEVRPFVGSHDD